ncbi:MAG: arginine--tRNA ligase [Elusimicrobiota bacterium]|jgi:arginyl-tRNA synthetase
MKTPRELLSERFKTAIRSALDLEADPLVMPAQNPEFGDYQSNAAMGLAKKARLSPRAVAEKILSKLDLSGIAEGASIAGPGFINVRLSPSWLAEQLKTLHGDERLGVEKASSPQRVVIDYSGPNVAKQMHVGHLRSSIIGDALARLIAFQGHSVIRQNHIGDWGTQFGMLIAYLRSSQPSAAEHISDLEAFYRNAKKRFDEDPAFAEESRATVVRLQAGGAEELSLWKKIVEETRRHYLPLYARMNVLLRAEDERGESFYNPLLPGVVETLKQKGVAVESEGAVAVFIDGYETPLLVRKSDGGYLYGTTDLAALRFRVSELKAQRLIYTHDSRQSQHFSMVFAAAKKAGWAENTLLEYAPFGTMLGTDGKPFKTRSGDTVKLKDLLDEAEERASKLVEQKNPDLPLAERRAIARAVGIGAVKYSDLSKDRTGDYMFSWDLMLSMDGNTAPYLQYAHTRIRSIFRKAGLEPSSLAGGAPTLETPQESALAKHLLRLGETIEDCAQTLRPHLLCAYLYELAARFSRFYEACPVLQSPEPQRSSRLLLCDLTARTLALGLDLLGIEHPEKM